MVRLKNVKFAKWAIAAQGMCMAFCVHAQSSVTLYGLIDEGLNYVSNEGGHVAFAQASGNIQGSRWGITGSEDLGGGYQAVFRLENGFALNNGTLGQGGLLFGRQAYVGFAAPGGTLTLGRQYDYQVLLYPMANMAQAGTYGFHLGDYDRVAGERLNNAIAYQSPTLMGGLKIGLLYAPGGVPGHLAEGSAQSYGISYGRGNLNMAVAYTSINNTTITPYASIGVPSLFGAVQTGTINLTRLSTVAAGASYKIGAVLVHGVYSLTDMKNGMASAVLSSWDGGVTYTLTPSMTVLGGVVYSRLDETHWNQYMLSLDYLLSKRTDLYAVLNYEHAHGGNALATLFTIPSSSGSNQAILSLGLRHRF